MARQKVRCALTLNSWQEANDALRQIGENRRDIAAIESVMNERIADAKATADAKARPIREQTALLETALKDFAIAHRADMGKAKSKALTFDVIEEALDYGAFKGLGQWRNGQNGRFKWQRIA